MADFQAGQITTTTTDADQVIISFTATSSLTLMLMHLGAAYTVYSATEAYLGYGKIQYDDGAGWETIDRSPPFINTDLDTNCPMIIRPLGNGHPMLSGEDIRAVCTPASATSMRWKAGFWFA